jgi:hypothetical protein
MKNPPKRKLHNVNQIANKNAKQLVHRAASHHLAS